jgi:hypothetical protein
MGCIQFINKGNNDSFAEIDEIFGLIFAYQTSLLLTSCVMYDALFYHSQLLRGLLEASTDLYAIIPESMSLAQSKTLSPTEVLVIVERTARDLLKCPNVRAFLISDSLADEKPGEFLFIQSNNHYKATSSVVPVRTAPLHAGVVGKVFSTRCAMLTPEGSIAPEWNPTVDLDQLTYSMLTAPVMDLNGTVLCVLQLIVGNRSPRLKQTDDPNDFRLFFGQAVEWLCHQLASPLSYLIHYIGRPAHRPVSTPSRIQKATLEDSQRSSFFSSSDEVVSHVTAADDADFQAIPLVDIAVKDEEAFQVRPSRNESPTIDMSSESEKKVRFCRESTNDYNTQLDKDRQQIAVLEETRVTLESKLMELSEQVDRNREELTSVIDENKALRDRLFTIEKAKKESDSTFMESEQEKVALERKLQALDQNHKVTVSELSNLKVVSEASKAALVEKESQYHALVLECKQLRETGSSSAAQETQLVQQLAQLKLTVKELSQGRDATNDNAASLTIKLNESLEREFQQSSEIQRLQTIIHSLEESIQQKEKTQAVLQEQVVKLANHKIEKIDNALSSSSAKSSSLVLETVSTTPEKPSHGKSDVIKASPVLATQQEEPQTSPGTEKPLADVNISTKSLKSAEPLSESNTSTTERLAFPDGWEELQDEFGRTYFYNASSGESSWNDPRRPTSSATGKSKISRGDWDQYFDDAGTEYWINRLTGESSWNVPAENESSDAAADVDEEDLASKQRREKGMSAVGDMYASNTSQFSISAGEYTIEL